MARLYFRYSTMNAGKSAEILKIAHNYEEQNKRPLIAVPALDERHGRGRVSSRLGLSREARVIEPGEDLFAAVAAERPDIVLIDEGQFLSRAEVVTLCRIVDGLGIPVVVYGLKNDYRNQLFPGSEALLLFADKIEEVKAVCWFCPKKATMLIKLVDGHPVAEGPQIELGGNEKYVSVCRPCYAARLLLV